MPDPIYPFFEEAFELLKKRVHIFNSVEELRTLIEKFRAGTLPRLRDESYYKKYMLGGEGNPKDTVMRRVNKFLGRE
jgi:hypothetical protein